jgi:hypothetical protein
MSSEWTWAELNKFTPFFGPTLIIRILHCPPTLFDLYHISGDWILPHATFDTPLPFIGFVLLTGPASSYESIRNAITSPRMRITLVHSRVGESITT